MRGYDCSNACAHKRTTQYNDLMLVNVLFTGCHHVCSHNVPQHDHLLASPRAFSCFSLLMACCMGLYRFYQTWGCAPFHSPTSTTWETFWVWLAPLRCWSQFLVISALQLLSAYMGVIAQCLAKADQVLLTKGEEWEQAPWHVLPQLPATFYKAYSFLSICSPISNAHGFPAKITFKASFTGRVFNSQPWISWQAKVRGVTLIPYPGGALKESAKQSRLLQQIPVLPILPGRDSSPKTAHCGPTVAQNCWKTVVTSYAFYDIFWQSYHRHTETELLQDCWKSRDVSWCVEKGRGVFLPVPFPTSSLEFRQGCLTVREIRESGETPPKHRAHECKRCAFLRPYSFQGRFLWTNAFVHTYPAYFDREVDWPELRESSSRDPF